MGPRVAQLCHATACLLDGPQDVVKRVVERGIDAAIGVVQVARKVRPHLADKEGVADVARQPPPSTRSRHTSLCPFGFRQTEMSGGAYSARTFSLS